MKINNKFKVDEKVYFLYDNSICAGEILGITSYVGKPNPWLHYHVSCRFLNHLDEYKRQFPEHRLFKTKEELTKSL